MLSRIYLGLLLAPLAAAQLIPAGQPIPKTAQPPVVFLNGYQASCGGSFSDTFGIADQTLQRAGLVSLFFDNCSIPNKPSIEDLGTAFGSYLNGLVYTDNSPVQQVDVVAHSMGGLIVRSYLAGKQNTPGAFTPPAIVRIRKAVFLSTPHFGTAVASLIGFQPDQQVSELTTGSRFLFDLATWNQGGDDLRGVDAVAATGNAGAGKTNLPAFDDGVVPLTSGSLKFVYAGRTRIVNACHITGFEVTLLGICPTSAPGIALITSDIQDSARVITSFLTGSTDWQTVGHAPEDDLFLATNAGIYTEFNTPFDVTQNLDSATFTGSDGTTLPFHIANQQIAWLDRVPAKGYKADLKSGSNEITVTGDLVPGATNVITASTGPSINRVFPAASAVFPLQLAPGMFISIYGSGLAAARADAPGLPYPTQLGGTQVLLNGTPLALQVVTTGQINAVIPDGVSGLLPLTVQNATGKRTVNILLAPSVPTLFTSDGTGSGLVAAENAVTGQVITTATPVHSGDYVALFLTGLGDTTSKNGLDYANLIPTVTIGGLACNVQYAGRAPGFVGLDQINCQLPSGLAADPAAQVVVQSSGRGSNLGTIPIGH